MQTRAAEILELEDLEILVKLGTGAQKATYWTCDYSHEYMWVDFTLAAIHIRPTTANLDLQNNQW